MSPEWDMCSLAWQGHAHGVFLNLVCVICICTGPKLCSLAQVTGHGLFLLFFLYIIRIYTALPQTSCAATVVSWELGGTRMTSDQCVPIEIII